jgi:cellulose synthase/poly-beta-1,6-N-acetylglucosamine synthase-like glycosyltransferase
MTLTVVLACFFIIYFIFLVVLLTGWKSAMQARKPSSPRGGKQPLISVVMPVRNEELTIWNALTCLGQQEYKHFQVIVVDDASEDETFWVASHFEMSNLQVTRNRGSGKKAAITTGVALAKGSIIATTDADCSPPPEWLTLIREEFQDRKTMMVFGGVRMAGDETYFSALQEMEFSSLVGTAAATAGLGFPTLCNGANLAFRKKVFSEVKGYQGNLHIASGDDEFLMRKIHDRHPNAVRFMNNSRAVVQTVIQEDLISFMNQRVRWASKWRFNTDWRSKSLAVFVLVLQLAFIINFVLLFSPRVLPSLFVISVKMILESAFLLQVCRFLGTRWNWLAFFGLQVFYPFYVLTTGVASLCMPFNWKNRIFKPREKPVST